MFFLSLGIAGKWTLITAVAPQSYRTSLASIQNFGGYIGGTVSPIVTGFVVDTTGSFVIALAIGAAITVLGAAMLQMLCVHRSAPPISKGTLIAMTAE
jgi:cyanate permease